MNNLAYFGYTNGVAATVASTLFRVPQVGPGSRQNFIGRVTTLPLNGQVKAEVSESPVGKQKKLLKQVFLLQTPRVVQPVGINPATGLAFVPSVVDQFQFKVEIIRPTTATSIENQDVFDEFLVFFNSGEVRSFLRDGINLTN